MKKRQGIVKLDEDAVQAIFESAADQADYLIGLYRLVFPHWDDIVSLARWPGCNDWTWKAICRLAMDTDKRLGVNAMHGGAWMNKGFSGHEHEDLANWEVSTQCCEVVVAKGGAA